MAALTVLSLAFIGSVLSHPLHQGASMEAMGLGSWHQPRDHPVHDLFKRQSSATVGSAEWAAQYPKSNSEIPDIPPEWAAALKALNDSGLIPNDVPITKNGKYPSGVDGNDPEICSAQYQCRGGWDVWDSPDGMIGIAFDDGPTENSPPLYDFLRNNSQRATHFMIGANIRDNPDIFLTAFNDNGDLAIHTWSHRFMSSLTNEEIVGELGWTAKIIYDSTGGRVPRYWRPPYGDSDNRVRAIAQGVFGLTAIQWNHDTDDWELDEDKTTPSKIHKLLLQWIKGPKSPGLMILEHELYEGTVQAFIDIYPEMKANGWDTRPISQLNNTGAYLNAVDNKGTVVSMADVIPGTVSIDLGDNTAAVPDATGTQATSSANPSETGSPSSGLSLTQSRSGQSYVFSAILTLITLWHVTGPASSLLAGL